MLNFAYKFVETSCSISSNLFNFSVIINTRFLFDDIVNTQKR
ncbi:unnamed protein product [Acanthoscelides obtectus]|uniref:Uncharacterized protein n=1 Tax=Acanthoscelides obtectus TaxID=200917 RepID=A0A9P0LCY1_ACAOB|nr:unnamed protein product [Acanthoscelides obtectus]CAK1655760.1 hypothetical protein AOBTE_LOCUS19310 [Acanthoscelides obtectus]